MANINLSGTIHNESQSKVINDRIALLETTMGGLCDTFGKIARKNARLRDTTDGLVAQLTEYSAKEKINTNSKKGLVSFGSFVSAVEDYRNAMIERVEKKIIQPISKYQEYLKSSKKIIKSTLTVRDKEKQKQQKLNQLLQSQPDNGRHIAQAEANAESASQTVSTQDRILNEEIDKLENKKLTDMKELMMEYAHIQMIFHAKALEMLTVGYQELLDINTEDDLEEFRNAFTQSNMKVPQTSSRHNLNTSQKNSYDSLYNDNGGSLPTTPKGSRANNSPRRAKSNENLKKSGQASRPSGQSNRNVHGSAPHLSNIVNEATGNSSLNSSRRSKTDMSEYTDDSDDEH